ncbi:MAG: ATP-binding protein [Planctomycetota bacterium]
MNHSSAQLGFPRKVVALYLLFCLGAVLLLATGVVFAVEALLKSQATGDALSQVGKLAAAIEMDHLKNDGEQAQSLVTKARADSRLSYCAVIGLDERFIAHSDQSLVGAVAVMPVGAQLRWGSIDGVRFRDESDRLVSEYRTPLEVDNDAVGTLVCAVAVPGWQGVLAGLGQHAPIVILAPVGLIGLGGWWLRKTTRPLAAIEERLSAMARLPHNASAQVDPVSASSLAAVGWNRLAAQQAELQQTARTGSEEKLKHLVAAATGGKSRAALESLSEGIAVTNAEGRIDFANRAIAALLSDQDSLEGEVLEELLETLSPESAEKVAASNPNTETITELPLGNEGSERVLRLARAPIAGEVDGGHVWTVRDVTQQKLAEASRDQFIDTATHELRTPLANIKAYAETLAMCDMSDVEQQKEFCNTINTEATRLARFVDDLLSISSIEVGTLGIDRRNVDVRRLLEEAADKVRPLMQKKSLTFEVNLAEKLGEASLDKDKVLGLVVNLLGNAAKYTPNGETVTLTAVKQEDKSYKIDVSDTGIGIAEHEQAKVFDKFFRSDNPEIKDEVGTGLGLSLAREIARLHRGDLTLTSTLGEGSTFTAVLPTS